MTEIARFCMIIFSYPVILSPLRLEIHIFRFQCVWAVFMITVLFKYINDEKSFFFFVLVHWNN